MTPMPQRRPKRIGRPSRLTPDIEKALIDALKGGVPLKYAAQYAGIGYRTVGRWMVRGEEADLAHDAGEPVPSEEVPYWRFWQAVQDARSASVVRNVALIQKAAQGGYVRKERIRRYRDPDTGQMVTETDREYADVQWRAAQWYLQQAFPAEFRLEAQQVEVSGPGGGPVRVEHGLVVASLADRVAAAVATRELEAAEDEEGVFDITGEPDAEDTQS